MGDTNEQVVKPDDWPANEIEWALERIQIQLDRFKEKPSYKNKEVLIALVSDYDLNQRSACGLLRTTDYEVACINSLYIGASILQIYALKTYLYELIEWKTRMQKIASWFPECNIDIHIEAFEYLIPQLKLCYFVYQKFTVEKEKTFAEQLIDVVENVVSYSREKLTIEEYRESVSNITRAYINLLNDISYFRCLKRTRIWAFDREEILQLFELAAKLVPINGDSPVVRPLKGVLMTCISNFVLKSRNDYNEDYIYKYLSPEVAVKSVQNHQIWMSAIEGLNDEREQRVVEELFAEDGWNHYVWATELDFTATRKYYVSSFSKSVNDENMCRNYGSCIYGYKDDRMADLLAPTIIYHVKDDETIPMISQVIAFDVIYDREEAKKELSYLCKIIDCFNMNREDKRRFLEEILQYWILSVKDSKWKHERERRYVLFMYDNYQYNEIEISNNGYLKMKTSLFIEPDFILGNNPVKDYIKMMVDDKRKAISTKPYLYCKKCLNRDYDVVAGMGNPESCSICGSKNIMIGNRAR